MVLVDGFRLHILEFETSCTDEITLINHSSPDLRVVEGANREETLRVVRWDMEETKSLGYGVGTLSGRAGEASQGRVC
jgi:hypothetical protein